MWAGVEKEKKYKNLSTVTRVYPQKENRLFDFD